MHKAKALPDLTYLGQCFLYDPSSGNLTWKRRPLHHFDSERAANTWNSKHSGTVAGNFTKTQYGKNGPVKISLGGRGSVSAHRVIWAMLKDCIPDGMYIDHINGDSWDNRLGNLRLASHTENARNRTPSKAPRHGVHGVGQDPSGRWFSQIAGCGRKTFRIGTFNTKGEAALAYAKHSLMLKGKFSPFYRKQLSPKC